MGSHPWWKVDVWLGPVPRFWLGTWLWYAFLNPEKQKSRAWCFEHIWSVFIFNNSQWVFMCLPLPMQAEFLTHRPLFFQFLHPTLAKWDEEQWKDQQAWYQLGGKVDFYPWSWPMAQAIHMKLILKLEKFQYHLWHRFIQDEEYPSLYSFRCKKLVLPWYLAWVSGIPCLSWSLNRLRWGLKDWQRHCLCYGLYWLKRRRRRGHWTFGKLPRLTLLGWGRFFHGTACLSACNGH